MVRFWNDLTFHIRNRLNTHTNNSPTINQNLFFEYKPNSSGALLGKNPKWKNKASKIEPIVIHKTLNTAISTLPVKNLFFNENLVEWESQQGLSLVH